MTPQSEALAYRIWAFAKDSEWNVTAQEIADHLGESVKRIGVVMQHKGWANRLSRKTLTREQIYEAMKTSYSPFAQDHNLDGGTFAPLMAEARRVSAMQGGAE